MTRQEPPRRVPGRKISRRPAGTLPGTPGGASASAHPNPRSAEAGAVRRRTRRTSRAAGIGLRTLAVAAFFFFFEFDPIAVEPLIRGIDVSHHQGRIDWRRVAADDVAFAYIKATEGGDYVDERFAANIREARRWGVAVGAYHFFTLCKPGADQARNFIAAVPRDKALLPPVVDIEFSDSCEARPSLSQFEADLTAFLEPVEAAFGQTALIYTAGDAAVAYGEAMPARPLWVRSIGARPARSDWTLWQYQDRGRIDGIKGHVDLNLMNGGPMRLAALSREAVW